MDARRLRFSIVFAVTASAACACAGCGGRSPSAADKIEQDQIAGYGELPGASKTHNHELKDELARLVSENATPALLARPVSFTPDAAANSSDNPRTSDQSPMPDDQNVAVALADVFAPKLLSAVAARSDELFPKGKLQIGAVHLEQVADFRRRYERQRQLARTALTRPACDFRLQHTAGLAADFRFLDTARIVCRLEAFAAAEALSENRLTDVLGALGYMLRMTSFLAAEKSVAARMEAARLRIETLLVLEAAAQHPQADARLHQQLFELAAGQLAQWTDDAEAWVGDRAQGLHTYELVRDGYVLSLLHEDELNRLTKAGELEAFTSAVTKHVDRDELFYLRAMRSIIESCKSPYYQRKKTFVRIRDDLASLSAKDWFPLVAENILLYEVEQGHVMQARDRSLFEGWAIALSAALGEAAPPYTISPLSGDPYQIERQETRIVVRGAGEPGVDRPIIIPITRHPVDAAPEESSPAVPVSRSLSGE